MNDTDDVKVVVVNGHDVYGCFNSYGAAIAWAGANLGTPDYFTAPLTILDEWVQAQR